MIGCRNFRLRPLALALWGPLALLSSCVVTILGQLLGQLATMGIYSFLVTPSKKEREGNLPTENKNPPDIHRYESIRANLNQVPLDQAGSEMSDDWLLLRS